MLEKDKVEGLVGYARRSILVQVPRCVSIEALNAHLEARWRERQGARLRGHDESIGERLARDREALLPLPAAPYVVSQRRFLNHHAHFHPPFCANCCKRPQVFREASMLMRARIAVRLRDHDLAAPTARVGVAGGWLAIGLAALLCFALWTTATAVLLTSDRREGGRVLACRYLTGAGVVER